jgi:hypothetical protein
MMEANRSSSVTDFAWISAAVFVAGVASTTATPSNANTDYQKNSGRAFEISPWADVARTAPDGFAPVGAPVAFEDWHFELSDRMTFLSEKQDGWKGPESLAALPMAFEHANHLLRKLAVEGVDLRPSVGLDYEGTFSFAWSDDRLNVDLTVYDDGTYSFFATDGERTATADDALVSERLSPQLLGLLLS